MNFGVIIISITFAVLLLWLQQKKVLATDTLLGILTQGALALGVIALELTGHHEVDEHGHGTVDMHGLLFGDISSVTTVDLYWIYGVATFSLLLIYFNWKGLITATLSEDIAQAENINPNRQRFLIVLIMTLMVAISIRVVGVLLITAMLIIPPATARQISNSPRSMAFKSALFGVLSVIIGVFSSAHYHIPAGPAIVVSSIILFIIFVIKPKML